MKKLAIIFILTFASISQAKNSPATVKLKPGLWEIASFIKKFEMAGVPESQLARGLGPRPVQKICITKQMSDAGFLSSGFPVLDGCTLSRKSEKGGRISYRMTCDNGKRVLTGSGIFNADKIDMETHLEQSGLEWQRIDSTVSGKWVGSCSA
jgi:Protein of unknown function (DUF3617)